MDVLLCVNCAKPRQQASRHLCWSCTNRKRRYRTLDPQEIASLKTKKRQPGALKCYFCETNSIRVTDGRITGLNYNICEPCWHCLASLKDPMKQYAMEEVAKKLAG